MSRQYWRTTCSSLGNEYGPAGERERKGGGRRAGSVESGARSAPGQARRLEQGRRRQQLMAQPSARALLLDSRVGAGKDMICLLRVLLVTLEGEGLSWVGLGGWSVGGTVGRGLGERLPALLGFLPRRPARGGGGGAHAGAGRRAARPGRGGGGGPSPEAHARTDDDDPGREISTSRDPHSRRSAQGCIGSSLAT